MEKIEFELLENDFAIKYKFFGKLNWSADGIGLELNYLAVNSKLEWYEKLSTESVSMAAATLGILFNDFRNGDEEVMIRCNDISQIVCSKQFDGFINNWFDAEGVLFKEGPFFDGIFGRFSSYENLGYPDNYEEEICEIYHWNKYAIKIIFSEKSSIDELQGKLFIDTSVESTFKNELNEIIELFNS
jgi:hypothetical protein